MPGTTAAVDASDTAGRALTARGRATRQRIVEAASDLMVERGVAAVSLDDVGRATATSKSQMYHYFADKDDLVAAVVGCVRDRILEFQGGLLAEVSTVDDLAGWADAIVRFQRQGDVWTGCPLGTLANELMAEAGSGRLDISAAYASWQLLIDAVLTTLQHEGRLRADADPAALATATLASLQGGLLLAKATQDETPLVVALDAAVDHLRSYAA